MQFYLENILRLGNHSPGVYYIAPRFHDATHLNQFFHELIGGIGIVTQILTHCSISAGSSRGGKKWNTL